jgi:AmmeMemoRadiSam system protein B
LDDANPDLPNVEAVPRVLIVPHAGYAYSGPTAAFGYKAWTTEMAQKMIKRVIIMGPSHYVALRGCALSSCSAVETPFGSLPIDEKMNQDLLMKARDVNFPIQFFSKEQDEAEHSLELHFPFIKLVLPQIEAICPLIIGSIGRVAEGKLGALLKPYLEDQSIAFVLSSDFCHWGRRFQYFYLPQSIKDDQTKEAEAELSSISISKQIENLDQEAMECIMKRDLDAFYKYFEKTGNTVCGRHPIGVFLNACSGCVNVRISFVKYAQSNAAQSKQDSSVSYAAGIFYI